MKTMEEENKLLVFKDPIYLRDYDSIDEKIKSLKAYGILDMDFLGDEGVVVYYDPSIIIPGHIIEGNQTMNKAGEDKPYLYFTYSMEMEFIYVTDDKEKILAEFPIEGDIFNLMALS